MIGKTNTEGGSVDINELTTTPSDVISGKKFYGTGNDEIQTGTLSLSGNAGAGDVLSGKTFYNTNAQSKQSGSLSLSGNAGDGNVLKGKTYYTTDAKTKRTGTMTDWTGNPNHITNRRIANGRFEVAVDSGYHGCNWNGNSYEYMSYGEVAGTLGLSAGNLAQGVTKCGLTGTYKGLGNAGVADVRKGKTFSTGSLSNATGTMPEQGGSTTIPGTANKTIVSANKYVNGNIVVAGDANLIAANIRKGTTIFGVAGTWQGYADPLVYLYKRGTWSNLQTAGLTGTGDSNDPVINTDYIRFSGSNPYVFCRLNQTVDLTNHSYIKLVTNATNAIHPGIEILSISKSSNSTIKTTNPVVINDSASNIYNLSSGSEHTLILNIANFTGMYYIYMGYSSAGSALYINELFLSTY